MPHTRKESHVDHKEIGSSQFKAAPMYRFPLGEAAEAVYLPVTSTTHIVDREEASLLALCSELATIDEHVSRILGPSRNADTAATLSDALQNLVDRGLILSLDSLITYLSGLPTADDPPGGIAWLAIPTANRPHLLSKAVESYDANFVRHKHRVSILISDDSCREDGLGVGPSRLEALVSTKSPCFYLGYTQKRRLIELLTQDHAFPRHIVEFAILGMAGNGPPIGANRNAILLQTAGSMLLSVDDDTLCRPCRPSVAPPPDTLTFGAEGDPTQIWFFRDRQSAMEFVAPFEIDIIGSHEALLGKALLNVMQQHLLTNGGIDISAACVHIFRHIHCATGRVLVTLNGAVGDSGIDAASVFSIIREPSTRARLTASRASFESGMHSRQILRQAVSYCICHSSPILSMFMGMDNRTLLPPFFPFYRNEDGMFGGVLSRAMEGSFFGYLPWSLTHSPPGRREYQCRSSSHITFADVLFACMSGWTPGPQARDDADRLRSLGAHLAGTAVMTFEDFTEFVWTRLLRQAGARIGHYEMLLGAYGNSPEYWAEYLEQEIECARRSVTQDHYPQPVDVSKCSISPLHEAQRLVGLYGELLIAWPDIFQAAKALNRDGVTAALRLN